MQCEQTWIIVAEERLGHWVAWFEHFAAEKRAGESLRVAVTNLLRSAGWSRFAVEAASAVSSGTTDCQALIVPLRNRPEWN